MTAFEQAVQAEVTRLRLIERILHEPSTRWEVMVAGSKAPMFSALTDDEFCIAAQFPAICPMEDEPVAWLLANGEEAYAFPLGDEVHSGHPFEFSVVWSFSSRVRDAS